MTSLEWAACSPGKNLRSGGYDKPSLLINATDGELHPRGTCNRRREPDSATYFRRRDIDNFLHGRLPELASHRHKAAGNAVVSWSASLDCIWVLETTSALGPSAVWTEITADKIVFSLGQIVTRLRRPFPRTDTFYRLRSCRLKQENFS